MLKIFRKKAPAVAAPIVALSVVFGAAAGFIGGLLAVDYLYPTAVPEPSSYMLCRGSQADRLGDGLVRPTGPVEQAKRAAVMFFDVPTGGDSSQLYWPGEAVAVGVTLTSDGWLISHSEWPKGVDPESAVAVIGNRDFPVETAVTDPASGILFLKVDAANLPVIGFDESSWFSPGDSLFAYDVDQGPRRLDVVGYGPVPAEKPDQAIVSSDTINQYLRLPAVDGILPGAMILDSQGQVVAIFAGNDRVGSSAVPVGDFSRQLEPIVREKAVDRPHLGVRYLDLSRVLGGAERRAGQDEGALLMTGAGGRPPAVAKGSPADEAGLRAGDLILAVNGEPVSASKSLAEIVSQYRSDSSLVLTVLRGAFTGNAANWRATGRTGAKIDITVELERLPAAAD